ncbi:MAG: Myo-inositol 2-dehydrogenase, partial [Adhaeribacter sp.]|nr:Myo-inositol 2-dehydrogenase [Adhaeribacter sp.]
NAESSLSIRVGNVFFGTEGYLELDGGTWKAYRKRETTPFAGSKAQEAKVADPTFRLASGGGAHYANFIDAIRAGKDSLLNCDINEGFYSSAVPLLANISYRLGRELKFMGDYEKFANDPEADTMLTRAYRKPYLISDQV